MGNEARVALYAPSTLAPYVSLPSTYGGSTGYYSPTTISGTSTWLSTALDGCMSTSQNTFVLDLLTLIDNSLDTPSTIAPLTTYRAAPTSIVLLFPNKSPSPSTLAAARRMTLASDKKLHINSDYL